MKPRILFVDDSRQILDSLARMLNGMRREWEMIWLDDPRLAWTTLQAEAFDAAVLDVRMPGLTGLELLQYMKTCDSTRDIPVVMLTGLEDRDLKRQALDLGAADLLNKPVQCEDLVARLKNVLRIKAYQDRLRLQTIELEKRVGERTAELHRSRLEAIWRLGKAAEHRDNETGNHVIRVGCMARVVAATLGLDHDLVETLFVASPLHDIGKIGIPDAILLKRSPLSQAEWHVMKQHCWIGERILHEEPRPKRVFERLVGMPVYDGGPSSNPWIDMAARIALTHHERWDGSGYPQALAGEAIPMESRITAIVDVFDALLSRRPYKPAFPEEKALAIMADEAESHFDPEVYRAFLQTLPELREIYHHLPDYFHVVDWMEAEHVSDPVCR